MRVVLLAAAALLVGESVALAQTPVAPATSALSPVPLAEKPAAPASPATASSTALVPAPAPVQTPTVAATPNAPDAIAGSVAQPGVPAQAGTFTAAAPQTAPALVKPKPRKVSPPPPPREAALSTDPTPTFGPESIYFTAKVAQHYAEIADAGGWPTVPSGLQPGAKGPAVSVLRRRLAIEGDLDASREGDAPFNQVWDEDLTRAVQHFQSRMGLKESGVVSGATLKAINVPARTRFRQLASSAQRIAGSTFPFGERYVAVNIPSTAVEAIENGRVVHRYVAIAGDIDHRSPEIAARVQSINLNPTWTVPTSIIKNEIIPHMRKDPTYLSRQRMRVLNGKGEEIDPRTIDWSTEKAVNYTLRQDSGAANSLGSIRINMPNREAVYMHDTPSKRLFGADYRFLSHGCVRVEGVYDLASWLLEGTGGSPTGKWDKAALLQGVATQDRIEVKLAKSVPVIWVYMTGWATPDGTAHFRDDIYGYDTVGDTVANAR